MKLKFPLIAAFVAVLSLTACGGSGSAPSGTTISSPAALSKTDIVVGTGAEATSGKNLTVNYTGWLYNASASDFKGTKFDSGSFSFTLGTGAVIPGFEQGVTGMKVGGKRTILIPAALGYGAAGAPGIPGNSGLVFEVELTAVK
jgi:FKBP-type peptidyl-prolyl cis-trans isomerase FkpA